MRFTIFTTILLPALSIAAPLDARQAEPCAPTSYSITNYEYTRGSAGARINFNFQSTFSNPSIVEDAASAGATCNAVNDQSGNIPNENECSTGRRNLFYDLRGPEQNGDFQIIHTWRCNGQEWMSSTHHKVDPLNCSTNGSGTTCTSTTNEFQAENVRRICSTPTCP